MKRLTLILAVVALVVTSLAFIVACDPAAPSSPTSVEIEHHHHHYTTPKTKRPAVKVPSYRKPLKSRR
ncbi:hypothetical protein ABTY96_03310 [Streptomyces sp. NPDC096057]|uniref:hypothetical protein n=1 Tax=Streptomyces sp. NPDC096057 TaxID=3155543 RepID=UPI00332ACB00